MDGARDLQLRAQRDESESLGRVYLVLSSQRETTTGTPVWGVTSGLVPRDAKATTLLGLATRALRDEMQLAAVVNDVLRTIQPRSNTIPLAAPAGYSFSDTASD